MLKSNHLFTILLTLFFGVIACQKEKKETIVEDKKDTISTTCSQKTYDSLLIIGNSKNLQYTSFWATINKYDSTNILEQKIWEAYNSDCNSCLEKLLNENNSFSTELPEINDLVIEIKKILNYKPKSLKYPELNSKKVKYNLNFINFKSQDLDNFSDTVVYTIYKDDKISPYKLSNELSASLNNFIGSYTTICVPSKKMDCKNDTLIVSYVKQRGEFITQSIGLNYRVACPDENNPFWIGVEYFSFNKTLDSVYYQNVSDYGVEPNLYIKIEDKWYRESELRKE